MGSKYHLMKGRLASPFFCFSLGQQAEFLLDFRGMSVFTNLIGGERVVRLWEMIGQGRTSSCSRNARLRIDHHGVKFDESMCHKRGELKNRGCGVTSGHGNQAGLANLGPMQFREAIHGLFQERRSGVGNVVPGLINLGAL